MIAQLRDECVRLPASIVRADVSRRAARDSRFSLTDPPEPAAIGNVTWRRMAVNLGLTQKGCRGATCRGGAAASVSGCSC